MKNKMILTSDEMLPNDLLTGIRSVISEARTRIQQTVNTAMVQTYWQIGCLIVEHEQKGESRAEYGKEQLQQLSIMLTKEFGKGFDVTNLRTMRRFYLSFPIRDAVRLELSWTHYRFILRVENPKAREWYMNEAIEQNWSARALDRQISVLYYERLLSSKDQTPVKAEAEEKTKPLKPSPKDFLRDPYLLDFLNLPIENYAETDLEKTLIQNLQRFILELGKGFAFVARQQRIQTEDQDFYIDLVFYNYKLKCFLLIDLKMDKLTYQDIGQMDGYVRMYDALQKEADDNPTIGLILCSEKSETIVKYSVLADSEQLFASKYMHYLPTEEELKLELVRERNLLTGQQDE